MNTRVIHHRIRRRERVVGNAPRIAKAADDAGIDDDAPGHLFLHVADRNRRRIHAAQHVAGEQAVNAAERMEVEAHVEERPAIRRRRA